MTHGRTTCNVHTDWEMKMFIFAVSRLVDSSASINSLMKAFSYHSDHLAQITLIECSSWSGLCIKKRAVF